MKVAPIAQKVLEKRNKEQFSFVTTEGTGRKLEENELKSRRYIIWTAKGPATYAEVDRNVFRSNNFKIVEYNYPIPKLEFIHRPSCAKMSTYGSISIRLERVKGFMKWTSLLLQKTFNLHWTFNDWLAVANNKIPESPPKVIEARYKDAFLLNGYTELYQSYYNNKTKPRSVVWNTIDSMVIAPRPVVGYGEEGLAVYYALQDYPVVNMTGFVIGSEWPWIEVLALQNGAAKVVTVEYQETKIVGTKKIEYIHPIEFAKQWSEKNESYDFSIPFSSIEHSGLGRYGDPIDPSGDLKEVQKVLCLLKRGGLFYLGIPRGKDALFYNAHRIYGRMRLAMMMTGFQWLATYRGNNAHSVTVTEEDYNRVSHTQDLYVLKKI
ncbi:unnamed protein product [Cylicocyclus nassatus]|uniref:DUF268 domain-containing protein n=1 Tax=Cylicocyclus nassatus TaxID=53992 RepID=A0AA36ME67_CYLNA|nr:unnamed protein product [Cylicocyclus nassatus]